MNLTSALHKAPQWLGALLFLWPCSVVQAAWCSENILGRGVPRVATPATLARSYVSSDNVRSLSVMDERSDTGFFNVAFDKATQTTRVMGDATAHGFQHNSDGLYVSPDGGQHLKKVMDESGRLSVWEMGPFEKHRQPVLSPTPDSRFECPILGKEVRWEAQNVYNPAAVVRDRKVYLFYRADDKNPALKWGRTCRIGMAWSEDGTNFTRHPTPVLYPDNDEWKQYEWEGGCEDLHIVEGEDGVYYMNYTTWSGSADTVSVASSRDLVHWTKHGPAFRKAAKIGGRSGVVIAKLAGDRLIAAKVHGKYWMYYTHPCALAWSENLIDWMPTGEAVWPGGGREAGAIALLRDEGILLMTQGGHPTLGAWVVRQALIDRRDLKSVLQEQKEPFLYPEYDWEKHGFTGATTVANTLVPFKGKWLLYYGGADRCVGLATFAPGAVSP